MQNHPIVTKALKYLSAQCDGASSHGESGFNAYDSQFGKDLAAKCDRFNLTDKQHMAALRLLGKYAKQLASADIVMPSQSQLEEWLQKRVLEPSSAQPKTISLGVNELQLRFPYEIDTIKRIKQIESARWHPDERYWSIDCDKIIELVELLPQFTLAKAAEGLLYKARADQLHLEELEAERRRKHELEVQELIAIANLDGGLLNGRKLFQHQKEDIAEIFKLSKLIVANDMGTGKSATALVAAKSYKIKYGCPVFVICPASLRENWKREAAMVEVDIEIFSSHHASIPDPLRYDSFILIVDECHQFSGSSQRTKSMINLAASDRCKSLMLLTGTPLRNGDPMNLFPLLKMIGHPLSKDKTLYRRNYCKGKSSHLDQLHRIITKDEKCMIRRTKKQCLDLPPFTRVFRAAEISKKAEREYQEKWSNLRAEYYQRVRDGQISTEGEMLVFLTHLRNAASWAKSETAIGLASELLEQGEQVLLFCSFRATAQKIAEALDAEVIDGDANSRGETQNICDRFQEGRNQSLVCMFGAGGVGLNLTASSNIVLVDRPWTTADTEQSESRAHRTGQFYPVTSYWITAFEIDRKIDALLLKKAGRINLVLEGKRSTMRGIDKIGDVAKELLEEIFA